MEAGHLGSGYGLADLVDMTHLRWILLRPPQLWPLRWQRSVLRHTPGLTSVLEADGWELLRVDRPPSHPAWYEALRSPRAATSILGTPLRPLAGRGSIEVSGRVLVGAGKAVIPVAVRNAGSEDWPATPFPGSSQEQIVSLAARIDERGLSPRAVWAGHIPLDRDLPAGEAMEMQAVFLAPQEPGDYAVRLALQQGDAAFDPATNPSLEVPLHIDP